jgi:hypothetical protein
MVFTSTEITLTSHGITLLIHIIIFLLLINLSRNLLFMGVTPLILTVKPIPAQNSIPNFCFIFQLSTDDKLKQSNIKNNYRKII